MPEITRDEKIRAEIHKVIGGLATDVVANLDNLREQIDAMQELVRVSSERVSHNLAEHAAICGEVQQEIVRLGNEIAEMRTAQINVRGTHGI